MAYLNMGDVMDWATVHSFVGKATAIAAIGTTFVYLAKKAIQEGKEGDSSTKAENEEASTPVRPTNKQNSSHARIIAQP